MALADTAKLVASLELQDKFSRPAGQITGSLTRMESGFSRIGRGAGQVAGGLDRLGTRAALAAAGGLAAVVTTAISFESAFAKVRKTVEASDAEFDELSDSFREMSRETGIAFEEFARIGEIAGALNVPTDSIDEFALAISKASVATGLSVDTLSDSVGRLGNIMKLDETTYATFLSTLVELGNKGASTEADILDIATRFAATGVQAELTEAQILGLSSAIAGLGVEPEAAGGALSRIMSNFLTETANATDKAKTFAKVAGVSFKEFAGIVEEDTLGAVLKFVGALDGLDKLEKFKLLKEAGITNQRDRNAILGFAEGIGEVNRQLALAEDQYGKTTALDEEFRKAQETTAVALNRVKENVRQVANTIGAELLPVIADLSTEFVEFLNLDTTQTGIKDFAKDLADGIRSLVTELKGTDFSGIIGGMKLAAEVAKGAFDAFRALPEPIQQLAIAALVANKVSGGAIGSIAKGLANIAIGGGMLLGRSPATAMWVRQVGLPGGGQNIIPGGGGFLAGVLRGAGRVFGLAAAATIGYEVGNFLGKTFFFDPQVQPTVELETKKFDEFLVTARGDPEVLQRGLDAVDRNLDALIGEERAGRIVAQIFFGEELALLEGQEAELKRLVAEAEATRNLKPITVDGVPAVAGPPREAAPQFAAMQQSIDALRRTAERELRAGNINAARHAQRTADRLERLRGSVDNLSFDIIPHLGKTNRALSLANRNLENGNRRQRELADKIDQNRKVTGTGFQKVDGSVGKLAPKLDRQVERTSALSARMIEARDATRSGFNATNSSLGSANVKLTNIQNKDWSPTVDVTVPVSTYVSITDIIRESTTYNVATSLGSQTRRGFTP